MREYSRLCGPVFFEFYGEPVRADESDLELGKKAISKTLARQYYLEIRDLERELYAAEPDDQRDTPPKK